VTSVVISHDMASTFRIADKLSMLYEGKILVTGKPADLLNAPFPPLQEFISMAGLSKNPAPVEATP
jgi:phospholipid/cholesterol/gamma-HCH transport system ATP-binding protein